MKGIIGRFVWLALLVLVILSFHAHAQQYILPSYSIKTIAGGGNMDTNNSTQATQVMLHDPKELAIHEQTGDIYLLDEYNIRKISKSTGYMQKLFGTSTFGYPSAGQQMSIVSLGNLTGIVLDGDAIYFGTFYTSTSFVFKIFENTTMMPSALVHTSNEVLKIQLGLADSSIYYLDSKQKKVWKKVVTESAITTGALNQPVGIHVSGALCYISDVGNNMINIVNTSSQTIHHLQPIDQPTSSFMDDQGNLFVSSGQFIKRIQADGNISIIAGSALAMSTADNLDATLSQLKFPISVKVWNREIYFIDRDERKVRKLTPSCNNGYTITQDLTMCYQNSPSSEVISCFGKLSNDSNVCSGNGTCYSHNNCQCYAGYSGSDCSALISNSTQPDPQVKTFNIWLSKNSDTIDESQSTQVYIISSLTELLTYEWKCINCSNFVNFTTSAQSSMLLVNSGNIPGTYLFQARAMKGSEMNSTVQHFTLTVVSSVTNPISNKFSVLGMPTLLISNKNNNVEYTFVISKLEMNDNIINSWMKECLVTESKCETKYSLAIYYKINSQTYLKKTETSIITLSQQVSYQKVSLKMPLLIQFSDNSIEPGSGSLLFSLNFTNLSGSEIVYSEDIPVYQVMKPVDSNNLLAGNPSSIDGVAIRDIFNLTINSWNSSVPLQYAIGVNYKGQLMRITDFSYNRTLSICFPYLKQSKYYISIIGMDDYGNIESITSTMPIKITPFDGNSLDLMNRVINSNSNFNILASIALDLTFDKSKDLNKQIVKQILLNNQFSNMFLLKYLTEIDSLLDQEVILNVESKFSDLLSTTKTTYQNSIQLYGYVKNKIFRSDTEQFLGVLSNLINDFDNIRQLTNSLSELLIIGEVSLNSTSFTELPKIEFNATNINLIISSFKIFKYSSYSQKSLLQGNNKVLFDSNEILSKYDAFEKECAISLINYGENRFNDSRNSSTSTIDFKFHKENQVVKLSNLVQPIILTFESNSINKSEEYSCNYWDEPSRVWSSEGCLVNQVQDSFIECACNHTTMFTTFIGQKRVATSIEVMNQLSDTYFAQISFGIFYLITALIVLITLIIFRKSQPIASRLSTPYIGMAALIVECSLIYIVQRSVLVDQLIRKTNISSDDSKNADSTATLLANIVMIFVNSLNLTAIFSFLIQVIRFELLKYFYDLISLKQENSKKATLKILKIITSSMLTISAYIAFCVVNLCYWTLWVILRGVDVISLETFGYIVSISYAVIILSMGCLISFVLVFDLILEFIKSKNRSFKELIFTQDSPLFFRWEMVLFIVSFVFMILNISLGLSTLESRYKSEEGFVRIRPNDNASFAFELVYIIFYILVFGGFSSLVTIYYKIKQYNRGGSQKLDNDNENKELFTLLGINHGSSLFESFCKKEFSPENLYLYHYIKQQNGNYNCEIISHIYENYVKAGSIMEVNIPSNCSKSFTKLVKEYCEEKQEIDNMVIAQCIETLMENVILNLSDTFSRFIFTDDYLSFSKDSEMIEKSMSKFNLVDNE